MWVAGEGRRVARRRLLPAFRRAAESSPRREGSGAGWAERPGVGQLNLKPEGQSSHG